MKSLLLYLNPESPLFHVTSNLHKIDPPSSPQRCVTYHKNSLLASYPLHQSPQPSILQLPSQAISRCCPTNLPSNLRLFNDVDTRATGETMPKKTGGTMAYLPLSYRFLYLHSSKYVISRGGLLERDSPWRQSCAPPPRYMCLQWGWDAEHGSIRFFKDGKGSVLLPSFYFFDIFGPFFGMLGDSDFE